MQVQAAWKRSLKLCSAEAIKTFALLAFKSFRDALKIPVVYWSCLLLLCVTYIILTAGLTVWLPRKIYVGLMSILFMLAVRPSVHLKDVTYFKTNFIRNFAIICFSLLFILVHALHSIIADNSYFVINRITSFLPFWFLAFICKIVLYMCLFLFYWLFLNIVICYFAFWFYADRREQVWQACRRAVIMYWYNLPAIFIQTLIFIIMLGGLRVSFSVLALVILGMESNLAVCIDVGITTLYDLAYICLMVNLYIKLVHDQYEVYFPEDKPVE